MFFLLSYVNNIPDIKTLEEVFGDRRITTQRRLLYRLHRLL